jgi:outer membrane lipoprotein carrier protein
MLVWAKPLICLLLAQLSWADSFTAIEAASRKIQSIDAEFTQTKQLKMLARPLESEGRLYYRRPGEFRWEYTKPIQSILIKNKHGTKRVTWRNGRFEAESEARLLPVQRVLEQLEHWLRGDFTQGTAFEARLISGATARVELKPRDKALSQYVSLVNVVLSSTPGVVDGIEIWEGPESVTKIQLKHVKLNQPLPVNAFELPK